ncbi:MULTISPECIES: S24 family peptidase [unclassified Sphingomonas]|uniref:S24 family peptidase n=1 Tax=unclassified Sphingomonas TaxID=196159 RepID=UPI0006F8E4B4|nr:MULTISPECIES: S24 family peptidase [unclassified Sphingomonas]KQX19546.1 peptidase S24 [Sphingomonas sp. Root1294]KQY65747.1 peptidase S24 [Sphingomonas sp. Root50]KRB94947.1 peptidase S24 [Sphingomonas sp. Root720]
MADDVRSALDALIRERGEDYSAISRLLGRNAAYVQQFIKRGTPRRLAEEDRLKLAAYFRVPEARLGGRGDGPAGGPPAPSALVTVPRIAIGASAGPGGIAEIEERGRPIAFDDGLLRDMGAGRRSALSIIRVAGESMEPTLHDGDDILVDRDAREIRTGGIYVLRLDDLLMVKRLIRDERGLVVHSDNPAHAAITGFDPATLQVIGRVLWCGRKL